mgnify:CR=1 FL=1
MKGKNEIRNVVICKYDQDKTKVFVFTKDGRVKERPYDEIKEDLEKILEPKIQNLIKNDIELQDDIKKLEEAKSVAAKYGNDSLQEQLELQAKEIEQLARRRAIQSLINTDTLYIVSSTEFIENFNNFTERSVGALIKRKQSSDGNYYNNQTGKPSIEEVIEEELERTKSTGENAEEKQKTKEKRKNEGQQSENSSDSEQADKKEEESKTEEAAEKTDSTGEEDSQENDTEKEESREKSTTSNSDEENGYQKTKKKTSDFQKGGTRTTSNDTDKTEQKETNEESDNGSQEQEEQDSNETAENDNDGSQEEANEDSDNGSQEQEEQDSNETVENDNDGSQEEATEESDNGSQEQEEQDSNETAENDNDGSQEEANEESDNGSQEREEQDSNETSGNDNDSSQEEANEESDNGSQEQEEQDSNETAGNDNDGSQENSGEESNEEGSNEENNGDDDFDFSEYDFDDDQPIDGYDEDAFDDDFDNENEDENDDDNDRTTSPKKENIIKRLWKKIKRSPIGKKITAVIVSAALIFGIGGGLYSCSKRQTREGVMNNSNIVTMNDSTVKQLLDVTTSQVQKESMSNLQKSIIGFNESFADAHTGSYQNAAGETVDVRAALSFDEMVALQQAYNDYSKTELKAYFNGTDVSKDSLTRSYKDASLQLMGAYVIETSEHPVDMSGLINSEEGKAFYNKYHQMFLAAKTATGDEKLEKIKEFYSAVKTDFPITQEVRTEGIAHADDYATLASYKLSVAPMIAAGEIMWQNLEVDETLDDSTIDFLNDLGLCNYAESKFGTIETISLTSESDSTNPLYEQYKSAFEKELKEKNIYVIDDEHRELSKLQEFQEAVNWHFENEESYGYSSGVVMTTSETYQEKYSWQESHTTYSSEQTRETVEASQIPDGVRNDLENQVNSEIASENEQAKQEAEKKAEETQKEMQKEEDKKAEQIEEEIKKDDQQFQDQVDKANETIDRNNSDQDTSNDEKVNESEFGGNVDFDEDHSDDNGNLDDSVENITTNGDGDQTGEELPDPNQTGAEFDKKAPSGDSSSSAEQLEEAPSTSTSGTGDETYEYEELIDQLIEQEAAQSSTETEGYQYTK